MEWSVVMRWKRAIARGPLQAILSHRIEAQGDAPAENELLALLDRMETDPLYVPETALQPEFLKERGPANSLHGLLHSADGHPRANGLVSICQVGVCIFGLKSCAASAIICSNALWAANSSMSISPIRL
jgi:hypothetical protein